MSQPPKPLFDSSFAQPGPNPDIAVEALCPGTVPLVLMPVRLETRFFTVPGAPTELRVRIYPDTIHADSHQPELTTDERTWGRQYWQLDWSAGNAAGPRADAWRMLANRFGAPRAAWIARVLEPTNLAQRPTAPVQAGQTPSIAPVFPTLPPVGVGGESAWRHAPQARLLPDRWTAVVHAGGKVALSVTGKNVPRPLAVGPDPQAPSLDAHTEAAVLAGDQLPVDAGMKWMVDFDAAEAVGMALRMTIPPATMALGLDSLVVFGVATSLGIPDTAAQLAGLFDAHHYTDGFEFMRYGTPTNNTDDRRAGYDSEDPGHARSFSNEVMTDPQSAPNALNIGTSLGLSFASSAATFGRLGQANQNHDLDLGSMNTALWQVGWGYFLSSIVGAQTGLSSAGFDWAREHFVKYVRAAGPFPALRCGSQPYGVLPVSSLDLWGPGAGEPAPEELWLKKLLLNLRDNVWRPVVPQVARVGMRQSPIDPDADLADVMMTDGVSHGYLTRSVLGRHYLEHLYALGAQDFSPFAQAQSAVSDRLVGLLGIPSAPAQLPHFAKAFFSRGAVALTAPLVQPGEVSPWRPLEPNYIGTLLALPTIQTAIDARPDPSAADRATSLLEMLLRHALLREIADAAARVASTVPGNDRAALLRDLELVDLVDAPVTNFTLQTPPNVLHWKRQLELNVPKITGAHSIGTFLEGLTKFDTTDTASLGEFRTSLAHLQGLDSESLQYLMQGTLDLSAHRLDAWITSFATKRLAAMTPDGPMGQYVGGYGWVENLTVAPAATVVPAESAPPGEPSPLFAPANDSGFIHAPSLTHAATAALLRNAHLGPTGVPEAGSPFAIDLSSRRAREASRLLDGVSQGQPLGALLGYQLERRLHDLNLDRFIMPLRNIAPLVVRARANDTLPAEQLGADNVVDGLVLLRRWQDPNDAALFAALPPAVTAELAALHDAVDGLGDALTAEVAYQMVRGNTSRMASALSAIAHGDAPPPELEVARTPRTGTAITHRLVVLLSGGPQTGPGWHEVNSSILSNTERMLNAWVSRVLGDARKVRCTVERLDAASGAVAQTMAFPLSELALTQLDFVYGVEAAGDAGRPSSDACAVEQLVLYNAQRRTGGFGNSTNLRLQHARPADLAAGELTLFDLLEQARAIRHLLDGARGARPADIGAPERPNGATIDLVELTARTVRGENGLNAAHKRLASIVSKGTATPAEDLRTAMLALGVYGIGPAVPCIAAGDTPDVRSALLRQAAALLKISGPRLDQGTALRTRPDATDEGARCDQLLERARAVFGAKFVVLPNFTCDAAAAAELKSALAASTQQQAGDPLAVHGWFTRYAQVRDSVARFGACMRGAEVLAAGDRLSLRVAQLPFESTERWVGLAPIPGTELAQSKVSMAVQSFGPFDPSLSLSGLLVDEWIEVVPSKDQTTAVAFQFNPPNAFAPQNVLVAVPPVPGQDWTTETLRRVLLETLDLAKLRAVDPNLLGAAAQYLPALYLPFNAADDAVSTDFAPLTR